MEEDKSRAPSLPPAYRGRAATSRENATIFRLTRPTNLPLLAAVIRQQRASARAHP